MSDEPSSVPPSTNSPSLANGGNGLSTNGTPTNGKVAADDSVKANDGDQDNVHNAEADDSGNKAEGKDKAEDKAEEKDDAEGDGALGSRGDFDWMEHMLSIYSKKVRLRELPKLVFNSIKFVLSVAKGFFILGAVLQLITATGAAAQLFAGQSALAAVLDATQHGRSLRTVLPDLVPVAIVTSIQWLAGSFQQVQQMYVSRRVNAMAEAKLLETATAVDLATFENPEFYDRLQRARAGLNSTWSLVSGTIGLLGNVLTIAAVIGALYVFHPLLVVFVACACLPAWAVSQGNARRDYELSMQMATDYRRLQYFSTVLTGRDEAKEVRAFDLSSELRSRWQAVTDEVLRRQKRLAIQSQARSMIGGLVGGGLLLGTVGFALWLLLSGRIAIAAAGAALYGIQRMKGQTTSALGSLTSLYGSGLFLNDYQTFIAIGQEAERHRPTRPAPKGFERLTVEDVTFAYPGSGTLALDHVSMDIKAGEVIALVGENGSGKTTLAKLLAQLYQPTSGRITWDGVDTAQCDGHGLRDSIAVIFQDFIRYHVTASENVAFGRVDGDHGAEGILSAAQKAGADGFLSRLPEGYNTVLSRVLAKGRDLSIGQWQRVALARAFFRDAGFIILDEPTAALDARAEHDLFEKIRELCQGRTVLLISHRFSSVRNADRIFVLENGRVTEQGNHDELMARDGLYAELFTLQASAYLDASELS